MHSTSWNFIFWHYLDYIKLYGTLDNFNMEYTERLHIDLEKDAYAATNHKDKFTQMTVWLEQKEKILRHHQYVDWQLTSGKTLWVSDSHGIDGCSQGIQTTLRDSQTFQGDS